MTTAPTDIGDCVRMGPLELMAAWALLLLLLVISSPLGIKPYGMPLGSCPGILSDSDPVVSDLADTKRPTYPLLPPHSSGKYSKKANFQKNARMGHL